MRKLLLGVVATVFFIACAQPAEPVKVEGDWKFKEQVEGSATLNPQEEAMITSIASLFIDGEVSMHVGVIQMKSPKRGSRKGTYTVSDGKLNAEFGASNQIILHMKNEGENLSILFGDASVEELGKIVLEKR